MCFLVHFSCVWAAYSDRTFEVGERSEVGVSRRYNLVAICEGVARKFTLKCKKSVFLLHFSCV